MNKVITVLVLSLCTISSFAQDLMPPPAPIEQEASEVFKKRFGGFINCNEEGSIVLVADARKDASSDEELVKEFRGLCFVPCAWEVKDIPQGDSPYGIAKRLLGDAKKYGAVVYVYDGEADAPMLVAYPENRISTINVTPLKIGADTNLYAERLHKEVWRGMCYAAGGSNSGNPYCVMNTVLNPMDLDAIETKTASPNATGNITNGYKKYGFGFLKRTTYLNACKQGWAPQPTNEYQQVIWDRVQKERSEATKNPSNPMKIKFDKSKRKNK